MEISASELPELVFVGTPFDEEKFEGPQYHFRMKPGGGLWTSPIREGKSEWEHYMEEKKDRLSAYLAHHKNIYPQTVRVDPAAKVFLISHDADVDYLEVKYRWEWRDIANDYDALYVDKPGVIAMHEGKWDLPSVVFLNLDYVKVNPQKL